MSQLDHWYKYAKSAALGDHLLPIVITSQAEGAKPSHGWPYGEGKSTLALGLAKKFWMDFCGYDENTAELMVMENLGYTWGHYGDAIRRGMEKRRIIVYIQDDLQHIAGKDLAHNKAVQWAAYQLTTKRPYLAIFIGTCTQLGDLAAAWRKPWMFEFKVYQRGKYECQFIKTKTRFNDPENPTKLLDLKNVPPVFNTFPKISGDLWNWYEKFRHEFNVEQFNKGWAKHFGTDGDPEPRPFTVREIAQARIKAGFKGDTTKDMALADELHAIAIGKQ
jgi:hypothetical protein